MNIQRQNIVAQFKQTIIAILKAKVLFLTHKYYLATEDKTVTLTRNKAGSTRGLNSFLNCTNTVQFE